MPLSNIPTGTPSLERWQRDRDTNIIIQGQELSALGSQVRNVQQRISGTGQNTTGQAIWQRPNVTNWNWTSGSYVASENFAGNTRVTLFGTLVTVPAITISTAAYTTISNVIPSNLLDTGTSSTFYTVGMFFTGSIFQQGIIAINPSVGNILLRAVGANATLVANSGLFTFYFQYITGVN